MVVVVVSGKALFQVHFLFYVFVCVLCVKGVFVCGFVCLKKTLAPVFPLLKKFFEVEKCVNCQNISRYIFETSETPKKCGNTGRPF